MEPLPIETTTYSLSSQPPAPDCRRENQRHLTLFRVGSLAIGERRELCLIKNISAGGMMIRAYGTIAEGTSLSVELKCGLPVSGHVTWSRGRDIGVEFDNKIDVLDLLATNGEGQRPRMPRIEVDCHATIRDGATVLRVKVGSGISALKVTPLHPPSFQRSTPAAAGRPGTVTTTSLPGRIRAS